LFGIPGTIFTFLGSLISIFLFKIEPPPYEIIQAHWKTLALLAVLQGAGLALENESIVYVSITFNQIIKSVTPAFTLCFSWLILGITFKKRFIVATVVIIVGAIIAIFKNPGFQLAGFITAFFSTVIQSIQLVIISLLVKNVKCGVLSLSLITSLPGVLTLLPFFLMLEYTKVSEHASKQPNQTMVFLTISGTLAFIYHIAGYLLILYTSAHYMSLIGNVKVLALIAISIPLFGDVNISVFNGIGMFILLVGFVSYNAMRYKEQKEQEAEEFSKIYLGELKEWDTSIQDESE